MEPDEYENEVELSMFANSPHLNGDLPFAAIGLSGEVGEFVNNVKKFMRDDMSEITRERQDAMADELGDALWYLTLCCKTIGVSLETVMARNVEKIRAKRKDV